MTITRSTDSEHTMENCDKCGHMAAVRWAKGDATLTFCGHHTNLFDVSLLTQGFTPSAIHPKREVFVQVALAEAKA